MEKFIKVTGIATHDTLLLPCVAYQEVALDTVSPFAFVTLTVMKGETDANIFTVTFDGTTDEAKYKAAVNALLDDIYDKANQQSYTAPMLERAADFYGPLTITNIALA
jgi:hypothetical protein